MRARDVFLVCSTTLAVVLVWGLLLQGHAPTGEWSGVDESVIGHFVETSGAAEAPLFDFVRGDALLFAFLVAGLVAGFVLGFFAKAALRDPKAAP